VKLQQVAKWSPIGHGYPMATIRIFMGVHGCPSNNFDGFTPMPGTAPASITPNAARLRPRLISIDDGYRYVGVGRSKFYSDFLPRLKTVRVGRRNLVDLGSLDQLVDELLAGE
jgi:hypothetical protein